MVRKQITLIRSVSIFLIGRFFCWHTIWGWVKIQFCRFHLISNIFLKVDIARVRPIPFEIYIRYQIGRPGVTNKIWHVKAFKNHELKFMWPCDLLNLNWLDGVGLFIQYEDRESREGLIWQSFYDRKLTETSNQPIRKIIWSELLIRRGIFSLIATFSNHSKKTFVFCFSLTILVYRGYHFVQ